VNCRSSDDHREQGDNANEEADDAKVWFLETFISAKYTVFRKKHPHSHFLLYLHVSCIDLNKNCSEFTQGVADSDNIKIMYSLRPMTSL